MPQFRQLAPVLALGCFVLQGCSLGGYETPDTAAFRGVWQLTSFTSSGSGLSFRVNETVVFDLNRTFSDSTAYFATAPITGQWSLPEAGKLRLHVESQDQVFLGGTDWDYVFSDNGNVLTLENAGLEKTFRRTQGGSATLQ